MNYRYKIQVLCNRSGQWYSRIIARNGRILYHSEMYSSKTKAKETAYNMYRYLIPNSIFVVRD